MTKAVLYKDIIRRISVVGSGMSKAIHSGIRSAAGRDTPSGNPFPGGSNNKGKVKLSSEQISLPRGKFRVMPIDNRVGNPITERKGISLPSANNKNKGSLLNSCHLIMSRRFRF